MYTVKELFPTLQGEGAHAGRAAVFCRFAGCNLWSGREEDRASAVCQFCDTDFVGSDGHGGGKFENATDVSPKAGSELIVLQANELKLVVPQAGHNALEKLMDRFEKMDYRNRFLQPMDGPNLKRNPELAVSLCQKRPLWRLSIQSHKLIGIR
jgi:organic radical activating enzyme